MKTVAYFILSICSIIYVASLCVMNICGEAMVASWETWGAIISGVATYGGLAIIFLFALINFFGNPIKIVFFVLLVLVIIVYILSVAVPSLFSGLVGGGNEEGAKAVISWLRF